MINGQRISEMARMVQLLEENGPYINKIARLSGKHKESVRYRYNEKILGKGFGLVARPNHESLGLRRIAILADLASRYEAVSKGFFTRMNETSYVVSYARTVPDGRYFITASVPDQLVGNFTGFLSELKKRRILDATLVSVFEWFRSPPMRAEFYDFDMDKWDVDLTKMGHRVLEAKQYTPSTEQPFDYTDLLLIKELVVDATRSLKEIGAKLGLGYKTVLRHFEHVDKRGLIQGYRTLWLGTRYDPKLDVVMKSKHRYLGLDLLVTNVSKRELPKLMTAISRLPFLWAEAGGPNYLAELMIPLDYTNEVLGYLRENLEPFRDRINHVIGDFDDALNFTISYQLYDQKRKRWSFDSKRALDVLQYSRIAQKPEVTGQA